MMEEEAKGKAAAAAPASKVDLTDDSLQVSIADALNEQDVVKFTVQTKTTLDRFQQREFQVTRQHEEFVWLHDRYVENESNAGFIIPSCPLKPDFSQSHGKLAKLQAGDQTMPAEEVEKLKAEIQGEYLVAFQKTVAMHEVFLKRLALHPVLREDPNLQVFLEYDKDLQARGRTKKEKFFGVLSRAAKSLDSSFASHTDSDEFYEQQKHFITYYTTVIKEAEKKAAAKVQKRQAVVSQYGKVGTLMSHFSNTQTQYATLADVLIKCAEGHGKAEIAEKKLAGKEDLKLTDLLRYYVADSLAARDLMWRRVKAYLLTEEKRKKLEAAKTKSKGVQEAQEAHEDAIKKYEGISKTAHEELDVFKKRRVAAFRKGIIQYTQSQIRQSREKFNMWKDLLGTIKTVSTA